MTRETSNTFSVSVVTVTAGNSTTYAYTGVVMPGDGQNSARAFDDTQVRNGMMIEQGGNNHGYECDNGIRFYDPATNTTGYIEPWLHSGPEYVRGNRDPAYLILDMQPDGYVFKNQYVYTYDNCHQIYFASLDKLIDLSGTGAIYDFATSQWTHGSAPPFVDAPKYMSGASIITPGVRIDPATDRHNYIDMDAVAQSAWTSGQSFYDGFRIYVPSLDIGVWIGGGSGGGGGFIGVLKRNPDYPASSSKPLIARAIGASEASFPLRSWSRNISTGVVISPTKIFIGDGQTRNNAEYNTDCYIIDVSPCVNFGLPIIESHYVGAKDAFAVDMGMCAWVLDTARNRVITVGRKVLAWSLTTEGPWIDISPSDWGYGFAWTKAMYHEPSDKIYFKGSKITSAASDVESSNQYNKMFYIQFD